MARTLCGTNGTIGFVECQEKTDYNGTKNTIGVINVAEKRTEQIAVRITADTKKILAEEAEKLDWAVSKLAERILSDWTKNRQNNGGAINFINNNIGSVNIK